MNRYVLLCSYAVNGDDFFQGAEKVGDYRTVKALYKAIGDDALHTLKEEVRGCGWTKEEESEFIEDRFENGFSVSIKEESLQPGRLFEAGWLWFEGTDGSAKQFSWQVLAIR